MATYYVSDTHFGHENIIKLCKRPFETVEEINGYAPVTLEEMKENNRIFKERYLETNGTQS